MTERMASGWMTVWRLTQGELKDSEKTQSRWYLRRYHREENRGVESAYEELKEWAAKRISFSQ